MADTNPEKINEILNKGVDEVIEKDHLKEKLESGKELRVKLGIDPTAPDLHLGHTVVLRKLKQFQDLGHKTILIIGDFTAQIGDPTGRDKTRPPLSPTDVKENAEKFWNQAEKILNRDKTEVQRNSKWLGTKNIIKTLKSATVQQVLRRADFQKRMEEENEITLLEAIYPVMQGYDSVEVEADVELGGTDQKFNLLMGRHVQKYFNQEPQDILTVPLIEGTDGSKKMSKSANNYIGLKESPNEMFGKVMSVPDNLIDKYFKTLTATTRQEDDPYQAKLSLAREIVSIYHSPEDAKKAQKNFKQVFSEGKSPESIPSLEVGSDKVGIVDLLTRADVESRGQAKRLINQGAVKLNNQKIEDFTKEVDVEDGDILKIGKKRFFRINR